MLLITLLFVNLLIVTANANPLLDGNIDYFQLFIGLSQISNPCRNQLLAIGNALNTSEEWALKMVDAIAKPQAGIMLGNIMHIGNYDECLSIDKKINNGRIQGKYCTTMFQLQPEYAEVLNSWFASAKMDSVSDVDKDGNTLIIAAQMSFGVCVPKICTIRDLQIAAKTVESALESPIHFEFVEDFCDDGHSPPFNTAAIIAIVIFSMFAVIVVSSTLYDILYGKKLDKDPNLYVSFSLVTNGKRLFSTRTSDDNLNCLNGIRVISMMWIVLSHSYQYLFFLPSVNSLDVFTKWKNKAQNSYIVGAGMSVDTFFTVSGLLLVYLFMKSQGKGAKFSLPLFYLHRILRLSPPLIMVVLFTATLIKYLGRGPFWIAIYQMFQKPCEDLWWTTVFYVQNYLHTADERCLGHSWYLAVDTHMYFISPLILFPLLRWPKQVIGALTAVIVLNCCYVFEITWKKDIGTTFFDQSQEQGDYIYIPTHVRGSVFLVGMICGYFVYKTKTNKSLKLSKVKVLLLWTISLLVLAGILLGHTAMVQDGQRTVLEKAFFNALIRVSWSLALSMIILLCVNGYGGFINDFLSHSIFTVLIRLNYSIYLLHLNLITIILAQARAPVYFSNMVAYHQFWGFYIYSVGISVLWTLVFESPVLVLEKIVFGKKKKSEPPTNDRTQNGKSNGDQVVVLQVSEVGNSSYNR